MNQSDNIADLAAALAKTQAEIEGAIKHSNNPHFESKYADLSSVWEAFQKVGPANGLSVVQIPGIYDANAKTMGMHIRLLHSSGQWIGGEMSVPLSKVDAQGYGSACTYARRYSLAAIVGICPEDDDGNAASQPTRGPQPVSDIPISREQLDELINELELVGADPKAFCAYLKVPALAALPAAQFDRAMAALAAKAKKEAA